MCDQYSVILVLACGGSLIYAYGFIHYVCDDIALAFGYLSLMVHEHVLGFYEDVVTSCRHCLFAPSQGLLLPSYSGLSGHDELEHLVYPSWAFWWLLCFI
jgi:nitric oxide reductase large subunit